MMSTAHSPQELPESAPCETKLLTADIYCCVSKRLGCRFGMSYGFEIFCQHPDKGMWTAQAHPDGCRESSHWRALQEGI